MKRPVKREPSSSVTGGNCKRRKESGSADVEQQQQFRSVKRERVSRSKRVEEEPRESPEASQQADSERRVLRSQYLAVKSFLKDERDDLVRPDSEKFSSIIDKVENLHQQVQRPREQVADAEALLGIASTLVTSVKSQFSEGIRPAEFLCCLLEEFGETSLSNEQVSVRWKDLGLALSSTFRTFYGCCTMLGPMNVVYKQRKVPVRRARTAKGLSVRPEELVDPGEQEKKDTERNMGIMFDTLRRKRSVRLEHLILNRTSFAQTVENLFALSFLVKDGRAEISIDENGIHLVSPKNAPTAGTVGYTHFVFRFDFKDWKIMVDEVPCGEELMPHRHRGLGTNSTNTRDVGGTESRAGIPTTPIRKLSRNRGFVIQEESMVEDSPEVNNDDSGRDGAIRKYKRKRRQ